MSARTASDGARRVWVYAVTTTQPALEPGEGIGGERLQLVAAAGIGAIIGEPRRTPRTGRDALVRYAAVMEGLARRRAALLPVRYGTCMTREDLWMALAARRQALRAGLWAVRNRVQMNVHVRATPPAARRSSVASLRGAGRRPLAQRMSGTRYLRARLEAVAREEEVPGFDPVRDAVRRWTRGERVERRQGHTVVCHLVPRASAGAYRGALERAAASHGLQVDVTGPWATYAFADSW